MKELNKKEAIGDLLDAFTEVCVSLDDVSGSLQQFVAYTVAGLKTLQAQLKENVLL